MPATNNNPARLLENSNRLIHTKEDTDNLEYAYANGIKTGDTAYAGRCLVASAQHDGVELLLVLFGDIEGDVPSEYRFENAAKFFDWGLCPVCFRAGFLPEPDHRVFRAHLQRCF